MIAHCRYRLIVVAAVALVSSHAIAQFSPGDLSRAHQSLEGMSNCAECHEVGKEISGAKCLTCHTEIKKSMDAQRGLHATALQTPCVSCHKEHHGREARITLFEPERFDHGKTSFMLSGKHKSVQCSDCHTKRNIKNEEILAIVSRGRPTYLGLESTCASCHEDRHRGVFGPDCQTCHGASGWKPVQALEHSRTMFILVAKHKTVACEKCHTEPTVGENRSRTSVLSTRRFSNCSPCHTSPHTSAKFAAQLCSSCHTPNGWHEVRDRQFNHDLTNFRLIGRHVTLKCTQCHNAEQGRKGLRLAHALCTDCHQDFHQGAFRTKRGGDCAQCHTEHGFSPSTYAIFAHQQSKFVLQGAHLAVPCSRCHTRSDDEGRPVFHFASLKCETCHRDPHRGQFKKEMANVSCGACHSNSDWKKPSFDHAKTGFTLVGKHGSAKCESCHKTKLKGKPDGASYARLSQRCESCHEDAHAKQFGAGGGTNCGTCHAPIGWTQLVFNHDVRSTFALTGAHRNVACRSCHREEVISGKKTVRYKPLSTKCESCHANPVSKNG